MPQSRLTKQNEFVTLHAVPYSIAVEFHPQEDIFVKTWIQRFTMGVATVVLAGLGVLAYAAGNQTITGEISDSMCGAKHMMEGKADCTRTCVGKGSNYALVVGDKVYILHTANKAALDQLSQLAGEQAKVTGTADGDTIEVSKVAASK